MSRRIRTVARAHPIASVAGGLLLIGLSLGVLGLAACSADSPSEPQQDPGTPPGTNPSATWNITVTLSPPEVAAGSDDPVQVDVRVRRADNNQPPPNGTTIVVAAGAGSFGSVGGPANVAVSTANGRVQVSYFPPATEGSVVIQARLENSVGQATLRIGDPATFFLASVQPSTGSPAGGEEVTIQGGGFANPVRVTFDGVPAQVLSVSPTRIRVVTPPASQNVPVGQTLAVTVAVTVHLNEEDQATDSLASAFIYTRGGVAQPAIFSVSPASGPNEGGTRVTLNGEGFQAPVQVFFGDGTTAESFTGLEATVESVTATRIVAVTPPATGFGQNNLNEVVDVLVKNVNSGFATVAQSAFQYGAGGGDVPFISAISPGQGPFTGGTRVTLFGQGFDEPVAVELAGFAQSILSVTGTEVVVRTVGIDVDSCNDVSGASEITNIETGESATGPSFTYRVPQPLITGVSPTSGPQGGGTTVTIDGLDFQEPVRVRFCRGGTCFAASIVSVSPTEIVVRTPSVPNDTLDEEECDDNADGTSGDRYVRTAFDVQVENLLTTCENEFEGAFNFVPLDQTCRGDVGETEPPPVECEDGFDNDGDGFIDEEDPECTGPGDDDESA